MRPPLFFLYAPNTEVARLPSGIIWNRSKERNQIRDMNNHREESSLNPKLEESWLARLKGEFEQEYMFKLKQFLLRERESHVVYPRGSDMFNAFNMTPFDDVKVVLLGQDPYHGPGQAHGLCFSVRDGVDAPPSLVNIFKEIERDLGLPRPNHGNLTGWARQGVFLLNTVLSVRQKAAKSHQGQGWETFTDRVIQSLGSEKENLVFLLWGSSARSKAAMIDRERHLVLEAPHPSPLSAHRGFLGCGHFSKANAWLEEKGIAQINWSL